jgi:hypothetical protein
VPEIFLRVALQNPQRPVLKANAAEFDAAACTRSVCWGNLRHSSPRQPHHPGDGNAENQEPRRKHHTARRLRPSLPVPHLACRFVDCVPVCVGLSLPRLQIARTLHTTPPLPSAQFGRARLGSRKMAPTSTRNSRETQDGARRDDAGEHASVEPIRAHMAPFSSNLCMVWLADSTMFRFGR